MVEEIKRNLDISTSDFTIKRRIFTIETPNDIKKYFLFGFYPSNIPNTPQYEEYINKMKDDERLYETKPLYYLYEPLHKIAQSNEFYYTIIVPQEHVQEWSEKYVEDYVGNKVATPPSPTTSTTTTPLTDIPEDYWEDVKATIPSIDSEEEFERILTKQRKTKEDKAAIASMFYDFYTIDSNNIHFDELVNSGLVEKGKRIYRIKLKEGYDRMYFDFASLRQNTMSDFKSWIDELIYPLLNDEIKAITLQRGMPYLRQIVAQVNGFTTTLTPKPKKTKEPKTTKEPKQPKQPKISKAKEIKNKLDEIDLDDI